MLVSIIIFLIIFGVIVVGHEFGHYAIARRGGIRVNEFDIGMGPALFTKQVGETKFSLNLLPIGGACIFDGMNGLEAQSGDLDEHAFPNAGVWTRIATVFGGPFANFILGYLFAFIVVAFCGIQPPVINSVMEGSAAEEAGLMAGDVITKINHESIHLYDEVSLFSMMNNGEPLDITVRRDGEKIQVTLTPRYNEEAGRYYIGLVGSTTEKLNAPNVFKYAFYQTFYWVKATYKSIFTIFTGHFSKDDLAGPVGIVKVVDDTYTEVRPYGLPSVILTFLNLATLLTVNLGIVNLLPLPALDGGRLVFLFIEAIRGKPIPPEKEGLVHLAGIFALIILMVFVLFNDISRFFR
ncbi:MAG: RIP metalloprotease RseP [Lachnospiraceae bacterium]|nr:RIP metalloprotease RseP [Lachnospiraceae bacterium]